MRGRIRTFFFVLFRISMEDTFKSRYVKRTFQLRIFVFLVSFPPGGRRPLGITVLTACCNSNVSNECYYYQSRIKWRGNISDGVMIKRDHGSIWTPNSSLRFGFRLKSPTSLHVRSFRPQLHLTVSDDFMQKAILQKDFCRSLSIEIGVWWCGHWDTHWSKMVSRAPSCW